MLFNAKKRASRRSAKGQAKINLAVFETLETRTMLSTTVSGYSTLMTDVSIGATSGQPGYSATSGVVNATTGTGTYANQSYAVMEFDPTNSTVYPGSNAAYTSAPTLAPSTTGGTLAANTTYYFQFTYTTTASETPASPESFITTGPSTSTNSIYVTIPSLPAGTTGLNIYMGSTSGGETLLNSTPLTSSTTSPYQITALPTSTTVPPAGNSTAYTLTPTTAPTGTPASTGGSLAANTSYYVTYTWVDANGESTASSEGVIPTGSSPSTSTYSIPLTLPAAPAGATSVNVYVGTTSGGETLNGSASASVGTAPSYTINFPSPTNASIAPTTNATAADVGAPSAPAFPVTTTTGGSLAKSTKYYVEYTWTTASGETLPSAEATFTSGATTTGEIPIVLPAAPVSATGANIYVGTTSGGEVFNGSIASPFTSHPNTYLIASPTSQSPPNSNTSGLTNPSTAATVTASTTGGTLAKSTKYYVEYTYTNATGETTGSTELNFTTAASTATNSALLLLPTLPAGATGINVYVGTSSGGEKLNGSVSSPSSTTSNAYLITTPPGATAAVPSSNSTGSVPNPASAATLAAATTGGTLAASTTYYVKYTWTGATGETLASTEASVTTGSSTKTNSITVTAPAASALAASMKVYVGTASGQELYNGALSTLSTTSNNVYTITSFTGLPGTNTAGVSNPAAGATLTVGATNGKLAKSTKYYVEYTWVTGTGETLGSTELSATTTSASTCSLGLATGVAPSGATALNIYVGTVSGQEILNGSIAAPSQTGPNYYTITAAPSSTNTAVPPASNNSYALASSTSAAALAGSTTGGTLLAGTKYYFDYTWVSATGETIASSEGSFTTAPTTSTNSVLLTLPAAPSGATSAKVYVGTATDFESLNGTISSPSTSASNYYTVTALSTPNATPLTNTSGTIGIATPTNLNLQLINNPSAWNSSSGATGNSATGFFDIFVLPTYTPAFSASTSSLVYSTQALFDASGAALPLGIESQGGLGSVTAANYELASFSPSATGIVNVPLTLPTTGGTSSAAYLLSMDLNNNLPFELVIVPDSATSSAQFAGQSVTYIDTMTPGGSPTVEANGLSNANGPVNLNEAPILSYTANTVAESFITPSTQISVNQSNPAIGDNSNQSSETAEIDVERLGYAGDAATVHYTTVNGSGLAGTDFGTVGSTTQVSGTLNFAAGQTVAVVSVPIIDTGNASDKTFTVVLSSPTGTVATPTIAAGNGTATVTIVGTTGSSDAIGGLLPSQKDITATQNQAFILTQASPNIESIGSVNGTYMNVNGGSNNGEGSFATPQYQILSFNASALGSGISVNNLTSMSLELDNYSSIYGNYTGYADPRDVLPANQAANALDAWQSPNPQHVGDFNIYLVEPSSTWLANTALAYLGNASSSPVAATFPNGDGNSGGFDPTKTVSVTNNDASSTSTKNVMILLGTASFDNPDTTNSNKSTNLGYNEGTQETYTIELSGLGKAWLQYDLNATNKTNPAATPIRLAIAAASPAFAADFANNNSAQGGNYGIQPYLWFNGTTTPAVIPAETVDIQYGAVNAISTQNAVAIDVTRPASGFTNDTLTATFALQDGGQNGAVLGTDYSAPTSETVTFVPGQTIATVLIPIIPNASATTEKSFTIHLTGASTTGPEPQPTFSSTPTTITIVPPVTTTSTALADRDYAAETSGPYSASYINGGPNGTGSYAYLGYEVFEFPSSQFLMPGQQITSLSNIALGISSLASPTSNPTVNYVGAPGDFTMYLAGAPETAVGTPGSTSTVGTENEAVSTEYFDTNWQDGVGGYQPSITGPLVATQIGNIGPKGINDLNDFAIPIGVMGFNGNLGMIYFTPTQAALNRQWTIPGITGTVSALQVIENQLNAGQAIRIFAAPGNSSFHDYPFGTGNGLESPRLQVADTVATTRTYENVGFASTLYSVADQNGTVTIPVNRSIIENDGSGLGDTLTVNYYTTDGNAYNGTNYTSSATVSSPGTLTFPPGVATENITIPISQVVDLGAKAFTVTLTNPQTADLTHYYPPAVTANALADVYITNTPNNAVTLTQYTSSAGKIGTNGPTAISSIGAVAPVAPFNFSVSTSGHILSAMDFNDSSVINFNDPAEFNSATGPITPTGPVDSNGNPTYLPPAGEPLGLGPVVYAPAAAAPSYSSTDLITAINEITLNFVNYTSSAAGGSLNVYLVSDATTNTQPGAAGTSKNPHYYDNSTSSTPDGNGWYGTTDGVGSTSFGGADPTNTTSASTQFGTSYLLGTVTNPNTINLTGYNYIPMTSFSTAAENILISDLNNGTKFRIVAAPEVAGSLDWIYNYVDANAGWAAVVGLPMNYYISPELSFDVSYATPTSQTPLPSYITPSANADYTWDSTTGNLVLTNGSVTFTEDVTADTNPADSTDPLVNVTASGPNTSVVIQSNQQLAGLTLSGDAQAIMQQSSPGGTVTIGSLTVNSGSTLDIGNGTLLTPETGLPMTELATTVQSKTITSSLVYGPNSQASRAIGYGDHNADLLTVPTGDVEVKYVPTGDTNLDDTVDITDLTRAINNLGLAAGYSGGDILNQGIVNIYDIGAIINDLGATLNASGDSAVVASAGSVGSTSEESTAVAANQPSASSDLPVFSDTPIQSDWLDPQLSVLAD